ncbi:hypothetical protein EJB05_34402, partial [Eragrostis curvula]
MTPPRLPQDPHSTSKNPTHNRNGRLLPVPSRSIDCLPESRGRLLRAAEMGGGGMKVDLTHGAVAAMSRMAEGLRPVLQVADVPRRSVAVAGAGAVRYRLLLSDGVHSQHGVLASSLNRLVWGGDLRRGTVVRVLDYMCSVIRNQRFIIVIQLEILQTECALIGNPIIYEATSTQPTAVSCSGGLGIHEPCVLPGALQVADNSSFVPGQFMLDSSFAPRGEHAVSGLQYGGCYGSVSPNTVDAKMRQLSLDDHQNQKLLVTTTGENFGTGSYGSPLPPSVCKERRCSAINEAPCHLTSVAALNPYKCRWKIKARVTAKTDLRHYSNARGPGKVFSFDLLDAEGGEIRVTCFNMQVDRYFDLIEVDKVYFISRGTLKPADKKYNPLNSDYEIVADDSTSIEICSDDDSRIPKQQYNFRQISEIENMENGSLVDLLGVVTLVGPSATLTRKDGKGIQKRTLQLKDMSDRSVEVTFFGKFCDGEGQELQQLCGSGSNPILALKGCRVSDLSGRSLVTISSTQLKVNPDFPEAERLRQWYLTVGKTTACVSLSQEVSSMGKNHVRKTIAQIKDENLGRSGGPDLITVRATISHVKAHNFCYPACTLEFDGKPCYRKVTRNSDGAWHCDKCTLSSPSCEYRYLLMCQLQDHTGVTYATAFQEAGTKIIGCSAEELFILRDQDEAKWEEIMLGVCWQEYLFNLKVKEETFYGESRTRCDIVGAEKIDASARNLHPLEEIDHRLKGVSGWTPEDASHYIPTVDFSNVKARQSVQTSKNACGTVTSVREAVYGQSADEFWLQAARNSRMSAPSSGLCKCSSRNDGFMHWSLDTRPFVRDNNWDPCIRCKQPGHVCFRCNQSGHWSRNCPWMSTA